MAAQLSGRPQYTSHRASAAMMVRPTYSEPKYAPVYMPGEINSSNEVKLPTNPALIGPGLWFAIHNMAINATTDQLINCFIEFTTQLIINHPCQECRTNGTIYLTNNPIDNYKIYVDENTDRKIGMFYWSFLFHNVVNKRLRKPELDWDTAWNLYADTSASCTADCG